jgi:Tol biopolymer transport system component
MRFTFDSGRDFGAVWSPNGTRLAFTSIRGADFGMYQKDSGGTGKEEFLLKSDLSVVPNSWSPDGQYLLYCANSQKTGSDLWLLPASAGTTPGSKPVPYLQEPYNERQGQFSPDGRWIAYSSDESGIYQVYVQSFPTGAGKVQVSTAGGSQPRWRRDGKEIFYISADGRLTAVDVKKEARFEAGAPHALLERQIPSGGPGTAIYGTFDYDVAADGKRFLVPTYATGTAGSAPAPITVIVNWQAALKH